jgi:hypothetical protein
MRRVTSPDGREWEIHVTRLRLPEWRDSEHDPWSDPGGFALAPIYWIVLPLIRVLLLLPFAALRAVWSRDRWIEGTCHWPSEITIRWKTTSDRAEDAVDLLSQRLTHGYEGLTHGYEGLDVDGAERESMTRPPGLDDLLGP